MEPEFSPPTAIPRWMRALSPGLIAHALSHVFLVNSLLALLSFGGSVVIQWVLTPLEVGKYTLIMALATMIGPLAAWGQGGQIIRLYGRERPGTFNWPNDISRIMAVALVTDALLCLAVYRAYGVLSALEVAVIGLLSALLTLIGLIVTVLRPHRQYVSSAALLRMPFAMSIAVGPIVHFLSIERLDMVLVGTALAFLVVGILALAVAYSGVPVGPRILSREERLEGTVYELWTISDMVGGYGEVALAGLLLPPASVALYGVARNIVRAFDLVRGSLDVVLATEIQRRGVVSLKRHLLGLACLAALLVFLHSVLAPYVLHILFRGRYDDAANAAVVLAVAGGLRLVQGLGHNSLIVHDDSRVLRQYLFLGLAVELASLIITAGMTMQLGIMGTTLAVCVAWLLRNLASYGVLLWNRRRIAS